MNTTHINTDTTYTTLHHVPGWRASLGAVGSLVANCHDSTEHTRRGRSSREGRHYAEKAEGTTIIVFCRAKRGIDIEHRAPPRYGKKIGPKRGLVSTSSPQIWHTGSGGKNGKNSEQIDAGIEFWGGKRAMDVKKTEMEGERERNDKTHIHHS